jgi:peptidoglycan/LPS O-acetylase OafA/YrhL
MTAPVEPRGDLRALTGARGIAAWLVVLYHVRLTFADALPADLVAILAKGYLAVDFFFMLSGFVIWLNYQDKIAAGGWAAVPHYLARRVARIWPLHLFVLGGAIAFAGLLALTGRGDSEQFPWAELPLHLLMIHNWGLTSALSWNDPSWSISAEFGAYLLFPLIALHIDWRRFGWDTLGLFVAALAAGLHILFTSQGGTILDHDIPRLGLARALIEFAMGSIGCAIWLKLRNRRGAPWMVAGWFIGVLVFRYASEAAETKTAPALLFLGLLLIAMLADRRWNPLAWAPIHYLGQISYSTYLVHFLGFVLFKILFVPDIGPAPIALLGLFLVLVLGASVLLYHLVERPAQRVLNRAFDGALRRFQARRTPFRPAG